MSIIEYNMSDLGTLEQLEWLSSLENKILSCGNDNITIYRDLDISSEDCLSLYRLIYLLHTNSGQDKSKHLYVEQY